MRRRAGEGKARQGQGLCPWPCLDATPPLADRPAMLVLDSHIDIPWPDGPDPFGETGRCVDIPKMRAGGMGAGCFVAYVPQTQCDDPNRAQARARATAMLDEIARMDRTQDNVVVRLTPTVAQIEAAAAAGAIAVIPAVENGHALGNAMETGAAFAAQGARYLTLTHNGHNDVADAAIPRRDLDDAPSRHGGLSDFGREVIAALNANGLLVDVSHAAKTTMMQAADLSRTPVVATHSCIRTLCDHPRNLDDEQLDRLAETGGVIQITAMPYFLRRDGRPASIGIDTMIDHIDYAIARIGIDHVGISSDFDGGGGIAGWMHAGQTANVTAALTARGYQPEQIAALWGGNFLRLLRRAEQHAGWS
jgi:membrane dipeptidase